MKKKLFFCIIMIVCFLTIGCNKMSNYEKDLIDHASKLIEFDFSKYIINAKGQYNIDKANITFEINSSKVNTFKQNIVKSIDIMPSGFKYEFNIDNDAVLIEKYYALKSGETLKTVSIIGILYSKKDKYYFNIIE